jgi:hypothetical protein
MPVNKKVHPNAWITNGTCTSCHHKRILYLESRNSDNPTASKFYKDYCKILNRVIKEAKRLHYNKLISHSKNRTKQIWDVINLETRRKIKNESINCLKVDDRSLTKPL